MSYESPIEIVATQFRVEREKALESEVFKAIHGLDITVHKEKLIKALRYDRNQYDKGYKDGYDDGYDKRASEVVREIFEEIEKEITLAIESNYRAKKEHYNHSVIPNYDNFNAMCDGKIYAMRGLLDFIEELKKKYTESEDTE